MVDSTRVRTVESSQLIIDRPDSAKFWYSGQFVGRCAVCHTAKRLVRLPVPVFGQRLEIEAFCAWHAAHSAISLTVAIETNSLISSFPPKNRYVRPSLQVAAYLNGEIYVKEKKYLPNVFGGRLIGFRQCFS